MTSKMDTAGLVERLRGYEDCCPFCGHDPYHYVDNGVGMERVAVTCCELGIALFQHGDEQLQEELDLRREAADLIEAFTQAAAPDMDGEDETGGASHG